MLSALKAGEDGVDEKEEREQRRKEFLEEYRCKLAVKRGDNMEGLSQAQLTARKEKRVQRLQTTMDPATFDPANMKYTE